MSASTAFGAGQILRLARRLSAPGFTARDRRDLEQWASAGRRVVISDGEPTAFAMLYEGSTSWASWAVARQEGVLVVWDCVSLADIGRFASMVEVLAALSGEGSGEAERISNVVSFAAARLRRLGDAVSPMGIQ